MVRKLPWDRRAVRPQGIDEPLLPRQTDDKNTASRTSRTSDLARRVRSPSTSPPPAPPTEQLMRAGMNHDDRYRMVEDELLSVARTFTAHLHAAEYQRLKAAAKSLGDQAMQAMARPVTEAPTARVRRQQEAARRQETLQRGLARAFGSDTGTGSRAVSPQKHTALTRLLDSSPPGALVLQEATGQPDAATDDETDDDLDGPFTARQAAPTVPQRLAFQTKPNAVQAEGADGETESDDDDDNLDLDGDSFLRALRQRREQRKKQRQKRR